MKTQIHPSFPSFFYNGTGFLLSSEVLPSTGVLNFISSHQYRLPITFQSIAIITLLNYSSEAQDPLQ